VLWELKMVVRDAADPNHPGVLLMQKVVRWSDLPPSLQELTKTTPEEMCHWVPLVESCGAKLWLGVCPMGTGLRPRRPS
jgi:hypothetical protein